jgi:hypothetical protein
VKFDHIPKFGILGRDMLIHQLRVDQAILTSTSFSGSRKQDEPDQEAGRFGLMIYYGGSRNEPEQEAGRFQNFSFS